MPKACDAPLGANNTIQAAEPRSVVKSKWYGDNTGTAYGEVTIGGLMCISEICDISPSGGMIHRISPRCLYRESASSTTLHLTACMVLIALRALCLSEATVYCSISLPILRHIAINLVGADVHDLEVVVYVC